MKQKFFNAVVVLVVLVLSLGLNNQATAQSSENSTSTTGTVKKSSEAMYMQTPDSKTGVYKTGNGTSLTVVDERGNVTITSNTDGKESVTVLVKPLINLEITDGSDFDSYIDHYMKWIKANPDYEKFVSAEEINLILADDFNSLYKLNYLIAQHQNASK